YLEVAVVEVEDTGEEVPDVELPENEPAGGPAKRFRAILGVSGSLDQKALEGDDRREVGQETAIAFAVVDFDLLPGDVQMILKENLRESE
ncbi:MAG: hypothetical protein PHG63_04120, partial [Candidatus Dojkabacteria bacterium]|nr:hypothetical protein [Candidatus Dojkabacteria bacterium]